LQGVNIIKQSSVKKTARLVQLAGMFDIDDPANQKESWFFDFELPDKWNVGAIVGASGSGKTTIAKHMFPNDYIEPFVWQAGLSVVDNFPKGLSIQEIIAALSSVGFSSPHRG